MRRVAVVGILVVLLALVAVCGGCRTQVRLSDLWDGGELVGALRVAHGGEVPLAEDFLTEAGREFCRCSGISVAYEAEPDFDVPGEASAVLVLRKSGMADERVTVRFSVVEDTAPPEIEGVTDRAVLLGEGAVLRDGVSVRDDCFGKVTLTVDSSVLDVSRVGYYQIIYTATDAVGNSASRVAYVTVYARDVSEDMLFRRVDALLETLYGADASAEERCRKIFGYLQANLQYLPLGDKTDRVRVAYTALFESRAGDCYSFYAAAWALLERAGIPTLTVERTAGVRADRHWWLMVNLAPEGEEARWYHLDATPLNGQEEEGFFPCLMTDAQLASYDARHPGFYAYDTSAYPASAVEIITPDGLRVLRPGGANGA